MKNADGATTTTSFLMPAYMDSRRQFPDDVELKSVFDFVSSLLSLMRTKEANWIICEGVEDYYFLVEHLCHIKNLRIVPVGGAGNVVKIFNYLYLPFKEKIERNLVKGRILCLIDTDDHMLPPPEYSGGNGDRLWIRRLQSSDDGRVYLAKMGSGDAYRKTVMEDAVFADLYYASAVEVIGRLEDGDASGLLDLYSERQGGTFALVNQDSTVFQPKNVQGYERRRELMDLLSSQKRAIAKAYSKVAKMLDPELKGWLLEVRLFFLGE